jgi:putative hydrolase of the HAD superfamily
VADFQTILAGAGETFSTAALDAAYAHSGRFLAAIWRDDRDVPVGDHVRAILGALDAGLSARLAPSVTAALVDAYARPVLAVPPAVDESALAALRTLSARGLTLALVSNTMRTPGTTLRTLLAHYGLLDCFAATAFSDEVGVRKPDPAIFAHALRAVGGQARAAVHVGDDPILDVRGARGAGMRVIQVTTGAPPAAAEAPDAVIARLAELPDAIARLDG